MTPNYQKLWDDDKFCAEKCRTTLHCDVFLAVHDHIRKHFKITPNLGWTFTDWGCGNGLHAKKIEENTGLQVQSLIDIAETPIPSEYQDRFIKDSVITADPPVSSVSYCTDVLEHLDVMDVGQAISNIQYSWRIQTRLYFRIDRRAD